MGMLNTCMRIFGWIPVIFITAVIVWSYFAYAVELCIFTIPSSGQWGLSVVFLFFYHVFLIMFMWAYYQTIFATQGDIPSEFYLSSSEVHRLEAEDRSEMQQELLKQITRDKGLPVATRTYGGGIRYCHICKLIKPDRCHHCSVCNRCILKMDHHCPWVNNCVAFRNYKYFVLFLFYALLYCFYVAITTLPYFIQFWSNGISKSGPADFQIVFVCLLAFMFLISVSTLFIMHIRLSCVNLSTLESFRAPVFRHGPDKDGFSRGSGCGNFREIFGEDERYWLLPLFSSKGNGVSYPIQARDQDSDRLLEDDNDPEMLSGSELGTPTRGAGKQEMKQSIKASTTYDSTTQAGHVAIQMDGQSSDGVSNPALDPGSDLSR